MFIGASGNPHSLLSSKVFLILQSSGLSAHIITGYNLGQYVTIQSILPLRRHIQLLINQSYRHSFSETIEVECDMSNLDGEVVTIVHNNLESEVYVTGYEAPGSYQRNLSYTLSWEHIAIIKNMSTHCEQFFEFTVGDLLCCTTFLETF